MQFAALLAFMYAGQTALAIYNIQWYSKRHRVLWEEPVPLAMWHALYAVYTIVPTLWIFSNTRRSTVGSKGAIRSMSKTNKIHLWNLITSIVASIVGAVPLGLWMALEIDLLVRQ